MEHLLDGQPSPLDLSVPIFPKLNPRANLVFVPYLPWGDASDSRTWAEYLQLWVGKKTWSLKGLDVPEEDRMEALAFLQQWFFFAMLEQFLEIQVNRQEFIADRHGTTCISTVELPTYLERWQDETKSFSLEEVQQRAEIADGMFLLLNNLLQSLTYEDAWYNHSPAREILLSIHILGYNLEFCKTQFYDLPHLQDFNVETLIRIEPQTHHTVGSRMLYESLVENGWCPYEATYIWKTLWEPGMYICSLLDSPHPGKDHKKCSDQECVVDQIDEKTYQTLHVTEGCTCNSLGPDMEDLSEIIDNGTASGDDPASYGIPLISMAAKGSSLDLEIIQWQPGIPYIAISHVWADGLGNITGNFLPECQLLKLRLSLVAPLYARMLSNPDKYGPYFMNQRLHIWFDTLCVPVSPMSARKAAIKTMKACYENASLVWVMDSGLLRTSINTAYHEILIRIATSPWLRRLWTLQEAVFAQDIVFQLKDSYTDFHSLGMPYSHTRFSRWERLPTSAMNALSTFFYGREKFSEYTTHLSNLRGSRRFAVLSEAVRWRSTSKSGDEPICLATLLELDLSEILDCPEEKRQIKLLHLQRQLPKDILFWAGTKLHDDGYRWAPRSFLSRPHYSMTEIGDTLQTEASAVCTPKGLLAPYVGIVVDEIAPLPMSVSLGALGNFIIMALPETQDSDAGYLTLLENGMSGTSNWRPAPDCKGLAIALRHSKEDVQTGLASSLQADVGVLVELQDTSAGVLDGKYVARVYCSREPAGFPESWRIGGCWVRSGQMWCIR